MRHRFEINNRNRDEHYGEAPHQLKGRKDRLARKRRLRNKKKRPRELVSPDAIIDLHDCHSAEEAKERCKDFFELAIEERWLIIKVITGRGNHSRKGPVLKPAIRELLLELVEDKIILDQKLDGAGGAYYAMLPLESPE